MIPRFGCKQRWHWLGTRIRCALAPDEPRLIPSHMQEGQLLAAQGCISQWDATRRSLALLVNTADDPVLPLHWRHTCLDQALRPLQQLGQLVRTDAQRCEWQWWRWRLSRIDLLNRDHLPDTGSA